MSKKIEDLRKAADAARAAAAAKPDDQALAAAVTKADEELAAAEAAAKTAKGVKVRVIADHPDHAINDVPTLPADDAKAAVEAGWADDHPAAVAYAESLAKD
jgi:hypothetical protein